MTGDLEALKSRIDESKKFDRKKDGLTSEMAKTRTVLKNDLEDRRERVDEAVSLFARYAVCILRYRDNMHRNRV